MVDKKLSEFSAVQASDVSDLVVLYLDGNNTIKNGRMAFQSFVSMLALLSGNNTFTGDNTFSGDAVFGGSATFNGGINGTATRATADASGNNIQNTYATKTELNQKSSFKLFHHGWFDYELSDMDWLRADTFSWQNGTVYTNAYNHLVDDIDGKTATSETIAGYTISYYLADDGHKITTDESTVADIYTATGVAWYYVLDTTNQRFKLPRTKYGFTGYRDAVGKYVPETLPNVSGSLAANAWEAGTTSNSGPFYTASTTTYSVSSGTNNQHGIGFNLSIASSTYQDDAPVQQRATQMYLYFYVGQFSQSATEQTAGLNSSLFNGKADVDLSNAVSNASSSAKETIVGWGLPDYTAVVTISTGSYTPPKDGLIRLGGGNNNYGKKITVNGADAAGAWVASSTSTDITAWVQKGDAVEITGSGVDVYFFPLKGVQNA